MLQALFPAVESDRVPLQKENHVIKHGAEKKFTARDPMLFYPWGWNLLIDVLSGVF